MYIYCMQTLPTIYHIIFKMGCLKEIEKGTASISGSQI